MSACRVLQVQPTRRHFSHALQPSRPFRKRPVNWHLILLRDFFFNQQVEEWEVLGDVWKVQGFIHTELGSRREGLPYLVMFDINEWKLVSVIVIYHRRIPAVKPAHSSVPLLLLLYRIAFFILGTMRCGCPLRNISRSSKTKPKLKYHLHLASILLFLFVLKIWFLCPKLVCFQLFSVKVTG